MTKYDVLKANIQTIRAYAQLEFAYNDVKSNESNLLPDEFKSLISILDSKKPSFNPPCNRMGRIILYRKNLGRMGRLKLKEGQSIALCEEAKREGMPLWDLIKKNIPSAWSYGIEEK